MHIDGRETERLAVQRASARVALSAIMLASFLGACTPSVPDLPVVERNVPVPMRDGVLLRADIWRPASEGRFPTLVYRTPYGKDATEDWYETHLRAVERGYAVVIQDVRGRYESDGEFFPYVNEGHDGFDTIEWAALQPWSNGSVGTYGLSYPGAVQWLAAVESPPHLEAMVPAMTFSSGRRFFYSNGVWDLSWLAWVYTSIAPDTRRRLGLIGPLTDEEAEAEWPRVADRMQTFLPLASLPDFERAAPFYTEWLHHPPEDPWWDWAELPGRYDRVNAAVLNLSGWYDEFYGPQGATTNFSGLLASRAGERDPRTRLVLGPWIHGVAAVGKQRTGDVDFGPEAVIDYDELILSWMDHYLRGIDNGVDREAPVRIFVMGENRWRDEAAWPPPSSVAVPRYLGASAGPGAPGALSEAPPPPGGQPSSFRSDPAAPVRDPYEVFGPHDYSGFTRSAGMLVFDTEPFAEDTEITGAIAAEMFVSCDCPDFDLWVKVLDVAPDGEALNLMSPGSDVQRASLRDPSRGRELLEPGEIYPLKLDNLITSRVFKAGHRLRILVTGSFFPHFSRNLQTGESESFSSAMATAEIRVFHDAEHPSRLVLPVVP
jgi:putative CocE/NonD family hydrolase